jgi:hypothetical protein
VEFKSHKDLRGTWWSQGPPKVPGISSSDGLLRKSSMFCPQTAQQELCLAAEGGRHRKTPCSGRGGRRFKSCHSDQCLAKLPVQSGTDMPIATWCFANTQESQFARHITTDASLTTMQRCNSSDWSSFPRKEQTGSRSREQAAGRSRGVTTPSIFQRDTRVRQT